MLFRFIRTLLVLSLLLLSITAFAQDAEPKPISVGDEVSGELSDSTDLWQISLEQGQWIVVDLYSDAFEPAVTINNAQGFFIKSDFGDDFGSSLVFVAPETADYFIVAGEFMGEATGAYTLRVRESGTISAGEALEGEIDRGAQPYRFEATAGTLISATLATTEFDAEVSLFDSAGDQLAYETSYGTDPAVLEYLLPADGTYAIVADYWYAGDSALGAFTLNLSQIVPEPLSIDTPTTVSMQGTARQYYAFEGTAESVVHISADSGTTAEAQGLDVNLVLTGPDGVELFSDDADGVGFDPSITRVMLPVDGYYLVKVIPADESDETQAGDVTLLVETAELLSLDAGAVTLTLGDTDRFEQDYVRFTGEPGMSYQLTITPERPVVSFSVNIGEGFFNSISVSYYNVDDATIRFTLPEAVEAGLVALSLRQSSFQNTTTYEITLEPIN